MSNTGGFGTTVIIPTGNGRPTNNALPAIDRRVFSNGFRAMKAPSFPVPRMAIIERVTPRTVNATRATSYAGSRARTIVSTGARRTANRVTAVARSIALRV